MAVAGQTGHRSADDNSGNLIADSPDQQRHYYSCIRNSLCWKKLDCRLLGWVQVPHLEMIKRLWAVWEGKASGRRERI